MAALPGFRFEGGEQRIDVRASTIAQVFDNRDPAPFHERGLDPDVVDYLFASAEDLLPHHRFSVVFWLADPAGGDRLAAAYRAHFAHELERIDRDRRRDRRSSRRALLVGVVLLVVTVSLAQLLPRIPAIGTTLKEGLTILSWVVMAHPLETMVFGWIPRRRHRRVIARLAIAPVEVRAGSGPSA